MLFLIGSEARRRQGRFLSDGVLMILAVVLVVVAAVGIIALATNLFSGSARETPSQTQIGPGQIERVETAPVVTPPAQDTMVEEPLLPTAPKIVDYRVEWAEVQGFNPSTILVEEGFYSGKQPDELSYSPSDPTDIPEGAAYAWRILPQLRENQGIGLDNWVPIDAARNIWLAAARDENNKDVVLVSLEADIYGRDFLVSVDREESWCRLNLLPIGHGEGIAPEEVRVVAQGEEIRLYGRYALGPGPDHLYWWETTVTKGELPCS